MTEEEVESQNTSYHHQTMLSSSAALWPSRVVDVSYDPVDVVVIFVVLLCKLT